MRRVYIFLLSFHPRPFRERFSTEMLGIFDEESKNGLPLRLLWDAAVSLIRQRTLRGGQVPPPVACTGGSQRIVWMFQTIEHPPMSRSALIHGALLALLTLAAISLAVGRGEGRFPRLLIGAKYPRPLVLPFDRSSIAAAEPTTEVKVKTPDADPADQLAEAYFQTIRVLTALDANRDHALSTWEMTTAASPLRRLDVNQDGELDAEECGFPAEVPPGSTREDALVQQARREFMGANPVLAALDTDRDGRIGPREIQTALASLRPLDRNRDGSLTPREILPARTDRRMASVFANLDKDRDRPISKQERVGVQGHSLNSLLDAADRDKNGFVTREELTRELQVRDEALRQLERAKRFGSAPQKHD